MAKKQKNGSNAPLKIENGIPVPLGYRSGKYGEITETLCKLQVGQSVLIPYFSKPAQLGGVRAIVQARMQIKLTTRTVEDGVRVWRVQ